jgi:Co/Zn/Cd efflux system component
MGDCCEHEDALERLGARQRATLRIVLAINAAMFGVELAAGLLARSTALLSDSLDNLGDALTYGLSLYAVGRGPRAKGFVALFKSALIGLGALAVLAQVAYRTFAPALPVFEAMGIVSLVALAANGACLALLWKHRAEDVNMRSVWECSRNDVVSNLAVLLAAGGVWAAQADWPDLAVGLALALLLMRSAAAVAAAALRELRAGTDLERAQLASRGPK